MTDQKYTNNEIYLMLKNLGEKMEMGFSSVEKGFKGVHNRMDITNGNVKTNTEFRIKADTAIMIFKWAIGILGVGNVGSIIYLFIK